MSRVPTIFFVGTFEESHPLLWISAFSHRRGSPSLTVGNFTRPIYRGELLHAFIGDIHFLSCRRELLSLARCTERDCLAQRTTNTLGDRDKENLRAPSRQKSHSRRFRTAILLRRFRYIFSVVLVAPMPLPFFFASTEFHSNADTANELDIIRLQLFLYDFPFNIN